MWSPRHNFCKTSTYYFFTIIIIFLVPTVDEEIADVKTKISDLEDEIAAAKKEVPKVMEYIISLQSELVELMKEENILLEKQMQLGGDILYLH